MGHDEDRLARIAHALEQGDHLACGVHVHVGKRFVEKQDFGIVQNRPRQRHALTHALGILAHRTCQIGVESDGTDCFLTPRIPGNSVEVREVAKVLDAAHFVVEERRVGHVTDVAAGRFRSPSKDRNFAAGGVCEPGERAQERGLSCPIVAEDGVEAPGIEFCGDAAQGGEASKLLDHVADGDGGSSRVSHDERQNSKPGKGCDSSDGSNSAYHCTAAEGSDIEDAVWSRREQAAQKRFAWPQERTAAAEAGFICGTYGRSKTRARPDFTDSLPFSAAC